VALSDDDLLDFDLKRLGGFETSPRTLLERHGDLYRSHLRIARWLDGYRERREKYMSPSTGLDAQFEAGALDTLSDLAAHLRQGDFLPGAALYEDEESG
jgi:hypothetical protein